jgi:hypothetical protein
MRPETNYPPKTNITSLAATAGVVAFVIWVASFAAQHNSIYAQASHQPAAASVDPAGTHKGADVGRAADQGAGRGQG